MIHDFVKSHSHKKTSENRLQKNFEKKSYFKKKNKSIIKDRTSSTATSKTKQLFLDYWLGTIRREMGS